MKRMHILFPEPTVTRLRRTARQQGRPIAEIVRRAVERHLAQLSPAGRISSRTPAFPTYSAGAIRVDASRMKDLIYEDDGV